MQNIEYLDLPQTAQDQQENTTASAPSEFNIQTFNTGPNNISIRGGPLVIVAFGPNSQTCTCPYCSHLVSTSVKSRATMKTHVMACVLCSIMAWCCCFCPYCMDSCQDRNHYCPNCNNYLGSYRV